MKKKDKAKTRKAKQPKMYYWLLNYFYDRKNSGTFHMKTSKKINSLDDDAVIEEALAQNLFGLEDARSIVDVEETTSKDYKERGGK